MKKVVFIDSVHGVLRDKLNSCGFICIDAVYKTKEEVLKETQDAFGIVVRSRFTLDRCFLEKANKLGFIARSGSGTENIDLNYCHEKDIQVFSSPEGNRNAVAEHALGFILALLNNFKKSQNDIALGEWNRPSNTGKELPNCTIGIIGCGNNGLALAKKLIALGARVLVYDKYKSINEPGIEQVPLTAFYTEVDVLSFHVPQTKETLYMGDFSFFSQFKKPLIVLNISRGKVLKTSGLVRAIKEGFVQKAALDVLEYETKSFEQFFENELPEDFLFLKNNENVMLTPHVAGWTEESYYKLSNVLASKIINRFCTKENEPLF